MFFFALNAKMDHAESAEAAERSCIGRFPYLTTHTECTEATEVKRENAYLNLSLREEKSRLVHHKIPR